MHVACTPVAVCGLNPGCVCACVCAGRAAVVSASELIRELLEVCVDSDAQTAAELNIPRPPAELDAAAVGDLLNMGVSFVHTGATMPRMSPWKA